MTLSSWPTWALRVLDAMFALSGLMPVLHWRVRMALVMREFIAEDEGIRGWWCVTPGGMA